MELCSVPPGQIMRRQVPPEKTKDVLEFATKKPSDRLESIRRGLQASPFIQSTATFTYDSPRLLGARLRSIGIRQGLQNGG